MKFLYTLILGFFMHTALAHIEPGFNVIGIELRTSNAQAFAQGSIGNLWQRFFSEQISSRIAHKSDTAIVAVYYNFETDKNGAYTILLGHRVESLDQIPDGLTGIHVPTQKTVIFTTPQGPVVPGIVQTWQEIWNLEDQHKLVRAYQFEYELYDERSQNPNDGVAEIHISVIE